MQVNASLIVCFVMIVGCMGDDRCVLKKDPGPCYALVPRWYYNYRSGTCTKFYYGGCKGNANNFKTENTCKNACPKCNLPAKTGPCLAAFRNYYYDGSDGKCKMFIYGGCLGNSNNFRTIKQCNKACNKY